ncbi:hypothetical protein HA402_011568 [Bradysia odoriphaga]|nr:hypothetical protein HA402_011568 [Bradysia odoriphaga]
MPNFITDWINNFMGNNVTYVANAYSHADYVWLRFQREELSIEEISAGLKSIEIDVKHKEMKMSLVRVPFNEVHIERRNTIREYMTVFARNRDGSKTTICENFEIPANRSYIVTDKGGIKEQAYGGDVWEDFEGHYHRK